MVDNKDIKLRLFADDLRSFVRNNYSLTKFLDVVERFGKSSGLKVNEEKTETSLLGKCAQTIYWQSEAKQRTAQKTPIHDE